MDFTIVRKVSFIALLWKIRMSRPDSLDILAFPEGWLPHRNGKSH